MADEAGATAGLYGKLPARGDFVRRRLAAAFCDGIDEWLQQSIADSRQALGDEWLAANLAMHRAT